MSNFTTSRCEDKHTRKVMRSFVDKHHSYIDYADRPARKLYWLLYENEKLVGVFGLSSAFSRPKPVQEYMQAHNLYFNEIGNNIVYCLHGQESRNAGSALLKQCRLDAVRWWKERYGDELRAFQCFVLPPRNGAVYKADNWELLGRTTAGKTQVTKTIRACDLSKYPEARKQEYNSGEVKYLLRTYKETPAKLIFMRKV